MLTDTKLDLECENAIEINQGNLFKILHDNCGTTYGKKHHFSDIRSVREYFDHVPLSSYQDFEDDIRQMREGKENILTAYPLNGFCTTSGTEGKIKHIPITCETLSQYSDYLERYKKQIVGESGQGKRLFINIFRTDLEQEQEEALLCSEVFYRWFYEHGELDTEQFAGGRELLFDTKTADGLYAKVWSGILTEGIVLLESVFQYDILHFFNYFEKHWEEVIRDIENGKILYFALLVLKENRDSLHVADILDQVLSDVNRDYMDLRNLGYLDKPAVYLTNRDGYQKVMESFRAEHRHDKPLHILPEGVSEAFLERLAYEAT